MVRAGHGDDFPQAGKRVGPVEHGGHGLPGQSLVPMRSGQRVDQFGGRYPVGQRSQSAIAQGGVTVDGAHGQGGIAGLAQFVPALAHEFAGEAAGPGRGEVADREVAAHLRIGEHCRHGIHVGLLEVCQVQPDGAQRRTGRVYGRHVFIACFLAHVGLLIFRNSGLFFDG